MIICPIALVPKLTRYFQMAIEIRVPQLHEPDRPVTIKAWQVDEGEKVAQGDVLLELEGENLLIELEASVAGTFSRKLRKQEETVYEGEVLGIFVPEPKAAINAVPQRILASPAARKLAGELKIPLDYIDGSGPGGRIVLSDVERAYAERTPPAVAVSRDLSRKAASRGSSERVRVRRLLASKMEEGWKTIPHFYLTISVDMSEVIRIRKDLRLTINDFVLSALTHALQEHPWVNSLWHGEEAVQKEQINLAVAVATEHGLYYPVIRQCETLSLKQLSEEMGMLADRAQSGQLQSDEMDGGTFTLSNMGMLGVEKLQAIITPPQVAMLSVGTVKGEVVVDDQGEPAVAPLMRLTLAADHRVMDGADGADFLDTLKCYLQAPVMLMSG